MIGVVHGALTSFAVALIVLVAQSWPAEDAWTAVDDDLCMCHCFDGAVVTESACRDDYRPAPPADGSWCGVRLDDRYPLRDDTFPIETPTE